MTTRAPLSTAYEFRLGGLYHGAGFTGPWTEAGGIDLNAEFLAPRLPLWQDKPWSEFMPRPQLGGTVNFSGKTSYAYAGLAWTWNITPNWFLETFAGGAIHDGKLDVPDSSHRLSLGCRTLFRIGDSIGYRWAENWSVMLTWEHLSNANLCSRNNGLNEIGIKAGFAF
jgi:hypothetical protein